MSPLGLSGNTGPMTDPAGYSIVPRLAEIAGLVHGFGRAGWSEADFLAFAASRDLRPVIMRQQHSDTIHRLDSMPNKKLEGDALMTDVPGLLLVIRTADCLPVLLVDEENRAVAAVHCGWRGTEKRILEKAVTAMGEAYGSKPADILAALGPASAPPATRSGRRLGNRSSRPASRRLFLSNTKNEGHAPLLTKRCMSPFRSQLGSLRPPAGPESRSSTFGRPTSGSLTGWASRERISSTPAPPAPTASRASCLIAATPPTPDGCIISLASRPADPIFNGSPLARACREIAGVSDGWTPARPRGEHQV